MTDIFHALVLNLHQPPWNLEGFVDSDDWQAKEILFALDRMPRALWGWEDTARVHLSLSGTLLETLSNPHFQSRVYGTVDCGSLLWYFQNRQIFDILGTGYYHPVLPLTPEADRAEHLWRWQAIGKHLFWREHFSGFWPPEMGFSMELIPLLKKFGYRYVFVDSKHVKPVEGSEMSWHDLRYRPHVARYGNDEIVVVVRDRDLSDAQESGMDLGWFEREVRDRTKHCDGAPPLVVTATDGENGGWFRNTTDGANYWTSFYQPLMEKARAGIENRTLRPTFVDDYLNAHGTFGEVTVETGAWNTGWHHGVDFVQWTGSQDQKDALERVAAVSRAVHDARWAAGERHLDDRETWHQLDEALWRLLRAETSCNFFWGEAWVPRAHQDLDAAEDHLARVRDRLR